MPKTLLAEGLSKEMACQMQVMEVFQEMVYKGCERSVITYSSLISACEKAGQWELALELFNEMHHEGCFPNTVTFNSLITACAQGKPQMSTVVACFTVLYEVTKRHLLGFNLFATKLRPYEVQV